QLSRPGRGLCDAAGQFRYLFGQLLVSPSDSLGTVRESVHRVSGLHRRIANLLLAVLVTTGPGVELIRGFLYHRAEFRVRSGTRTPLRDLVEATCGLVGRGERIDQGDYLLGEWGDRVRQFPVPVGDLPCSLGELPGLRRQL